MSGTTRCRDPKGHLERTRNTGDQLAYYDDLAAFIEGSEESPLVQVNSFATYAPRQAITSFIERYELYKLVRDVPGSILECGVAAGQGLMSFAHFCSIFEPYHYTRKVIGFDTFEGFVGIGEEDATSGAAHLVPGGLRFDAYEKLQESIRLHDRNRALGHLPKVELVKGDISETLPGYVERNPALVVALLYLDMDIFRPTRDTLELLGPRIPRGGIIAFDELNHGDYPGETLALMETLGIDGLRLRRLEMSSMMCFARVGD